MFKCYVFMTIDQYVLFMFLMKFTWIKWPP